MSWTDALTVGLIAEQLHPLAGLTWDPDGTTGNLFEETIPDQPDNAAGVTAYNLQPDALLADVIQPVQIMLRGDRAFVRDTADLIFDTLHGVENLIVGGIACPVILLHSDARLGLDDQGRTLRAVNYDVHANRPTASRPD